MYDASSCTDAYIILPREFLKNTSLALFDNDQKLCNKYKLPLDLSCQKQCTENTIQ